MRLAAGTLAVVLAVVVGGCSSGSSKPSGPPSCTDTSVSGTRLLRGCTENGHTYAARTTTCLDGRTLINVPDAPPSGVSAYSDGRLRTRAASTDEVSVCTTGQHLQP